MIGETTAGLVELHGGLMVRESAYHLLLNMEARGHGCRLRDGALLVTRSASLTSQDRTDIATHRAHLVAMVAQLETP